MLLGFIILYMVGTILIGWWASRRIKNTKDFVVAGGSLPAIVVATGLFAEWFGSETVMGASAEFVDHGIMGIIEDPFGAALCLIMIIFFVTKPLYKLKLLTFSDYYRIRYSKRTEIISAFFMVPSYFSWIAAQLIALAIVLHTVTGAPITIGLIVCTLIVMFYTYIGGMWSVSITDFIQTIMIVVGLLVLLVDVVWKAGGPGAIAAQTPPGFFRFLPEPHFKQIVWYVSAWITVGLGSVPQQDIFQRIMSAKSERTAIQASLISAVLYLSVAFMPLVIALCGKILYPELAAGDKQMMIPLMVLRHGSIVMQIFFFGALLSAILSTTSGAMLAPATVIGENLIKPLFPKLTDRQLLHVMQYAVVLVGVISAVLASFQGNIYELVGSSSSLSLISLFVPLVAGIYWKRASTAGAISAMFVGLLSWAWFEFNEGEYPSIIYGLLGSIGAMVIASLIWPDRADREVSLAAAAG